MPVSDKGGPPEATDLNVAAILDELCRTPPGRKDPWTNGEVARACQAQGQEIADTYVQALRTGERDNPTVAHLQALAAALDVHPAALVGGTRRRVRDGERAGWRPEAVRHLTDTVYPLTRGPWTADEIAQAITDRGRWGRISTKYVRTLIKGHPNPFLKTVLGLSDHFGVPPAYFFDDEFARTVDEEAAAFKEFLRSGVVAMVTRAEQQSARRGAPRRAALRAIRHALGQTGDRT
ncbi:hypothetical protein [Longimycelium tulufanense]|uniref:hypothetical protein n=1 Tax=Longimycelium tulufanense TaxID=907463 RepID=UPI0016656429|nr:hypothetical protein [Longimycelium tulufanense]